MTVNAWLPVLAILSLNTTARADAPGATPPSQPTTANLSWQPAPDRSWPEEIESDGGQTAPLGYTAVERTRKGLIIGGAITFGVGYLYSAAIASSDRDDAMWIPIAGAFAAIEKTDNNVVKVGLAAVGSAQVIGAFMLYYGITTTKRVFVRSDLVTDVSIAPLAGNGASGMALSGRF